MHARLLHRVVRGQAVHEVRHHEADHGGVRAQENVRKRFLRATLSWLEESGLKRLRERLPQVVELVVKIGTRFRVEHTIKHKRLEIVLMLTLRGLDLILTLILLLLWTSRVFTQHAAMVFVKPTTRAVGTV